MVIVDPALRDNLALAPATPGYQRALAAAAPEVYVGTTARLARLVNLLGPAIANNFRAQGMDMPPWRSRTALLHRWSVVEEQERVLKVRWESERQQAQQAFVPRDVKAQPPTQVTELLKYEVVWPNGMPPLDEVAAARAAAAAAQVVPVVGFAVGSAVIADREPWYDTTSCTFSADSFLQRTSMAESDTSSADSEEIVLPFSPVSIFGDITPFAAAASVKAVVAGFL